MKLTVAIPCFNQLEDTKGIWGCHIANIEDKENTELLVVANGCTDDTVNFLNRFVFPYFPDHKLIINQENQGLIFPLNQCYKESKGDVIAILHNDVYVFDRGWDKDVLAEFEKDPKLGLAGFLGATGVGPTGGRQGTLSNMLEAEIHGERFTGVKPVVIFDGLSLICRRTMLDQVGGFDQGYAYHHFYDRDISLASYYGGWTNKVIGVFCHHRSGLTANRPDHQKWIDQKMGTSNFTGDKASYDASERYFIQKWGNKLPRWNP